MVGERIVIVEDESIVALNIQMRLEAANFHVAGIADSGRTAIALIEAEMPDLVLMDIRLKGNQTGIQVAENIQTQWNIPVVYLTAYADEMTVHHAHHTAPYGYLLKPFETRELYSAIQIALDRHRAAQQLQLHNEELERRVQERTEALELINEKLKAEVAERERAEAEAIQALNKEREYSDLKSRFITTASHEFRTPLSIVLTSAELLERLGNDCDDDRRVRYLQKVRDAVRSMTTILTDLLTLGKANAGTLNFRPQLFDLRAFCQHLLSELQVDPEIVRLDYRSDRTEVGLDPELLDLMLNNLLSNAIKYSPNYAPHPMAVTLTVEFCEDQKVRFEVRDRGIGIPEEDLPRLFESFHRARNVDTISGTGLGLSIVAHCVELHSGEIHIDSQLNEGTTVTVTLPLYLGSDRS